LLEEQKDKSDILIHLILRNQLLLVEELPELLLLLIHPVESVPLILELELEVDELKVRRVLEVGIGGLRSEK